MLQANFLLIHIHITIQFNFYDKLIIKMQFSHRFSRLLLHIFIISLIIESSIALHIHLKADQVINSKANHILDSFVQHRQTGIDQSLVTYVQTLKQQKNSFQSQLLNIQSYTSNIEKQISSISASSSNVSQKINLYEDLILTTRQKLTQLRKQLNIPLNQTSSTCQSMTLQQKQILSSDISQINNKIMDINSTIVSQMGSSTPKQSLTQFMDQIKLENNQILENTNAIIQQNQTSPQINNNTNLIDPQWLVGNQTVSALNDNIQAENLNLYGISCPAQTPYAISNNQCVKCPSSLPYFDISLSKCVVCLTVDQNHNCLDALKTPTNTPTYNSTNFEANSSKLLVPPNQTLNYYVQKPSNNTCPIDTPFYDGKNCINCQQLFDLSTKTCTSCKSPQIYNSSTHTCQNTTTPYTNTTIPNTSTPTSTIYATNKDNYTNILIPTGQTFDQYKSDQAGKALNNKIIYCNSSNPYFNGSACVSCNQNEVFSIITMSCTNCSTLQFYNNVTHHCQNKLFYSNLEDQNWMSKIKTPEQISSDQLVASKIVGSQQCPYSTPYYNNSTCIACSNAQYFNFDSLKCQSCPLNQAFSKSTHSCQKVQGYYQTNPSIAPNLIYDGHPKNQWMHIYYSNIDTNPQIQDCPANTPYFDGASCISCTTQKPYFNLGTQVCQQCPSGQNYDLTTHQCLSSGKDLATQAPTLQKMAAGIFS